MHFLYFLFKLALVAQGSLQKQQRFGSPLHAPVPREERLRVVQHHCAAGKLAFHKRFADILGFSLVPASHVAKQYFHTSPAPTSPAPTSPPTSAAPTSKAPTSAAPTSAAPTSAAPTSVTPA